MSEIELALSRIERYLDSNPENLNRIEARQIVINALEAMTKKEINK